MEWLLGNTAVQGLIVALVIALLQVALARLSMFLGRKGWRRSQLVVDKTRGTLPLDAGRPSVPPPSNGVSGELDTDTPPDMRRPR